MKKICTKCHIQRPKIAFYKDSSKPDGLYSSCKDCYRNRIGSKKRPERYKALKGEKLRRCGNCNKYLRHNNFYTNPSVKDGLHTHCKPCSRAFTTSDNAKSKRRSRRQEERSRILQVYGGSNPKCACCGENHKEFLAIDHINGGGNAHRKTLKTDFYRWIIQQGYPDGFQILCHNCNTAKGSYGECPHNYETDKKITT